MADAQKNEIKPWLKQQWVIPPKANAAFVANREDVLDTYAKPYDSRHPVVCVDEGGKPLIGDLREPLPVRPGSPAKEDCVYERGGMANLFLAFEPLAGKRLVGVTEPEQKRKTIGELFVRVFEENIGGLTDATFLVQGTLYPDVIESGGSDGTAAVIKSHHNVGGLPEDMTLKLIEPLRSLFKDEVRRLGTELGLPDEITWRQPFPGPGLGVRIIGEVTPQRVAILQEADFIVREEIRKAGLEREIWQAFAVLADIRSVGVMGDERTYENPIIIRAVTSDDAMTADWARLPYDLLETMSSRIINEVDGINRVVYDITSKPPGTIEWE